MDSESKEQKLYKKRFRILSVFNVIIVIASSIYFVLMFFLYRDKDVFLNPFYYKPKPPPFMNDGLPRSSSDNIGGTTQRSNAVSSEDPTKYYVKTSNNFYYYPLYLSRYMAQINSTDGLVVEQKFSEYPNIIFYMPNSNKNIQQLNPPFIDDIIEYNF